MQSDLHWTQDETEPLRFKGLAYCMDPKHVVNI